GCVAGEPRGVCSGELSIPEGVSGLVWLHALSLPGDRRPVKTGKRLVIVGGGSRDLALKATPDRPTYEPRGRATIDVAVTGAGGAASRVRGTASRATRVRGGLEPSDAYQPAAEHDVRGAVLAVLSTMPAAGGFEGATAHELDRRAGAAVDEARTRIAGLCILV